MDRSFPLKEIALQAGVSLATVDRVLNGRAGVREHTVRRVRQAIDELEHQRSQVGLNGRKFVLDVVIEAPARFTQAVRGGLDLAFPTLLPAVFRARYHVAETRAAEATVDLLEDVLRRGSNGVLLKAPDIPEVRSVVRRIIKAGIPVVTLVTDLLETDRLAYIGIDNRAAGETAAYLLGEWLKRDGGQILVTVSSNRFRGEEEREIGFRRALRERYPTLSVVEISEGHGIDASTGELVSQALAAHADIVGIYSIGGGNLAVVDAFSRAGRGYGAFVGHDLDADNLGLLRHGKISAVLHHDLAMDMRAACVAIMEASGFRPRGRPAVKLSNIQIVTPFNLPHAPE